MLKKILIAVQFVTLFTLSSFVFTSEIGFPKGIISLPIVSAADSSQFQNTSPWFVSWWNGIKSKASSTVQWFQSFIPSATPGRQSPTPNQNPLSQYPALSGQNSGNNQGQLPFQNQGDQGGGSQQQGGENGTSGSPYKIEPNQFKKICGTNNYILYWRKGGKNGRDMAQPVQQGPGAGKDQEGYVHWQLPTCEELAECHCCCNTCVTPESQCKSPGWVFNNKGCPPNCKPTCEGDCKPKCQSWTKPEGPGDPTLNRDCKCNQEGCPKSNAKGCKIMIIDSGKSQVDYTKQDSSKPEEYYKGTGIAIFKDGNGPMDLKSKVRQESNDTQKDGWIMKLKNEKGKCCKCYQDGPPIQ